MTDAWDLAMRGLSDLELGLIMQGAKNGTLKAVGAPENSFGAGLKAAMELNRRAAANAPRAAIADRNPTGGDVKQAPWRSDESGGAKGNRPNPVGHLLHKRSD